jgi:Zn-dependent protease with chaperone function
MLALNLGLGSFVIYAFWWIFNFLKDKMLRNMMVSVTIDSHDSVYKWLLVYLTEKGYLAENMADVVVKLVKKKRNWYEPKKAKEKPKVEYYPSPGKHFFVYKGKKMWAF